MKLNKSTRNAVAICWFRLADGSIRKLESKVYNKYKWKKLSAEEALLLEHKNYPDLIKGNPSARWTHHFVVFNQ